MGSSGWGWWGSVGVRIGGGGWCVRWWRRWRCGGATSTTTSLDGVLAESYSGPMTTTTCTVSTATGGPCGAPAVTTFTGATGRTYGECAAHTIRVGREALALGVRVEVTHVGVRKTGVVVGITPTRVRVRVPVYAGTPKAAEKVVTFERTAVRAIA